MFVFWKSVQNSKSWYIVACVKHLKQQGVDVGAATSGLHLGLEVRANDQDKVYCCDAKDVGDPAAFMYV